MADARGRFFTSRADRPLMGWPPLEDLDQVLSRKSVRQAVDHIFKGERSVQVYDVAWLGLGWSRPLQGQISRDAAEGFKIQYDVMQTTIVPAPGTEHIKGGKGVKVLLGKDTQISQYYCAGTPLADQVVLRKVLSPGDSVVYLHLMDGVPLPKNERKVPIPNTQDVLHLSPDHQYYVVPDGCPTYMVPHPVPDPGGVEGIDYRNLYMCTCKHDCLMDQTPFDPTKDSETGTDLEFFARGAWNRCTLRSYCAENQTVEVDMAGEILTVPTHIVWATTYWPTPLSHCCCNTGTTRQKRCTCMCTRTFTEEEIVDAILCGDMRIPSIMRNILGKGAIQTVELPQPGTPTSPFASAIPHQDKKRARDEEELEAAPPAPKKAATEKAE